MLSIENSKVIFINLDRRPDLRIAASNQFRRAGFEAMRLSAPDSAVVQEARGWRNKGARACALGHRLAWRAAHRAKAETVCVFEDDVMLCRDFGERLRQLEFPDDWQIIYLGCTIRKLPAIVAPGVVRITDTTWSTHAMLIRVDILPRLHRLCVPHSRRVRSATKGPIAIDNLISSLHAELKVYAAYPFLAWQAPGRSEIDPSIKTCWDQNGRQTRFLDVIEELDRAMAAYMVTEKPPTEEVRLIETL